MFYLKEFKRIKLERTPIFKENGAITISKLENIEEQALDRKIKTGHIALLPYESIRINSNYEFWIAEKILQNGMHFNI